MINKFQQGGQAKQQQQLDQIFSMLNEQPEETVKQLIQSGIKPEQIVQLVQVGAQQKKIKPEIAQSILSAFKRKALHGAKLQYIKNLNHQCAEDEELYYYKKGGSIGCGCKKKEDGGKVKKAQSGTKAVDKFKNRDQATKDSIEANVHNNQDIQNNISGKTPGDYKRNKQGKMQWTPDRTKAPYKKPEKKEKGSKIEKNCGGSAVTKFKMKCGNKLKKHFFGGTI